ncbi:BZIP protein 11 [Abeliophyllum distichum]|uniref:BZIP protein 11 n=1 Tax=Abeliophyllum distichum TaxID=126358 RepID=A0ABD1SA69_9LAMI
MGLQLGVDVGGSRKGRGRRKRGQSLLEPVNRAKRRAIKNMETAARSRARMRATILGLESRKVSLEEQNDQLLKEKLMEKVIRLWKSECLHTSCVEFVPWNGNHFHVRRMR